MYVGKERVPENYWIVVETCNIYKILLRVIHHNLILHKKKSGKGERNILGRLLVHAIYT